MKTKKIISVVIAAVIILVLLSGTYLVNETEQVVVTQFGKPVGNAIITPGLKFKIPFIQKINYFEKRYLEWDGDPDQMPTKDKKYIYVDSYARWNITDPLQFFKRMKNELGAQTRIDDILDGETRSFVATHYIEEIVRTSNRISIPTDTLAGLLLDDSLKTISIGRAEIQRKILKAANNQTKDLGIEILDFRFKRINYTEDVREKVYNRMKTERFRIADKFRSEGQGEASRINGEKERELKRIYSEAFRDAEQIKGNADAKAAAIYSFAYNQTSTSRELYSFLKSMETFDKTFDDKTSIILSTNSELYKHLKSMK